MIVEFIWQKDCPNVTAARRNLMQAFSVAEVAASWTEWCVDEADCPEHLRELGSPTLLVDGRDIAGGTGSEGASCRVYTEPDGSFTGVPPVELIAQALGSSKKAPISQPNKPGFSWRRLAAMVPSIGIALLPKIACPACWPAYAGVLSSFGVTFLIDSRYLFALTALFLAIALFFLGFRAKKRRGYAPLLLGALASAVLLVGKFYFESDPAMFTGVGLLMIASFWNSWPRQKAASPECSACEPTPVGSCCP